MIQCQEILYRNGKVYITQDEVKFVPGDYSKCEKAINRDFKRIPIIKSIRKSDLDYWFDLNYTDQAAGCDFARFIANTSADNLDLNIPNALTQNEVNKITALGYMLTDWKTLSEPKAVVIRNRHLGQFANGKSLIMYAVGMIRNIDIRYSFDEYALYAIDPDADIILIDDVDRRFEFIHLFQALTGDLVLHRKAQSDIVIDWEESPKFVLITNDYIKNAHQGSVKRRIAYVDVSGHYSGIRSPFDDFGHRFFYDWDSLQWQLFDNFMMDCIMYYFRSYNNNWGGPGRGIVPPPEKSIKSI